MLDTLSIYARAVTMNVWALLIEIFGKFLKRDAILSERLANLEKDAGLKVTEESVTHSQLEEVITRMDKLLAPTDTTTR